MRLEGWEGRLALAVSAAHAQPYELGRHDCFRLACRIVEALTGVDRWPEFAGRYTTERGALHLLAQHASSFEAAFDWFFGSPSVNVRLARRGDIAAIEGPDGKKHLGVVIDERVAALGPEGLVYVPCATCLCAWKVG